ncbi:hypothetical protein [Enterococcus saccharolyticus]|uniref:Uncharacterized protein n=1 Tax=Enterococcus saccharolyticus subsp. saccharolyticus ATCC 43076 TaxID=1139996 RepID=S0NIB9_9ENTE|nr:hypothetical protein [Enterococcus saccharolyticus]EOT26308.1 hypothetical protein OMQ_02083 [Enterococcus saccharolyticus subsp. saccharolyticus ATCC 43076]EOT76268.1 hypothetical protein I572_02456 [Enterococcus saccharolyticus subsp. saccharolyticus ATCC 43076]OJG85237.1 hypothetical protein RV16_GL001377 [Enterococcus saccharolyticus]
MIHPEKQAIKNRIKRMVKWSRYVMVGMFLGLTGLAIITGNYWLIFIGIVGVSLTSVYFRKLTQAVKEIAVTDDDCN